MTRRSRPQRTCDAPGCDVAVKRGILMCRDHWFATPIELRREINAAWKERRIRDWSAACLQARAWHHENPAAATRAAPPPRALRQFGIDLSHPEYRHED